jgi:hypothetical protein
MRICMCVCMDECECKDCKVKGLPRLLPYLWRYSQARPVCPLKWIGPCPNPGRGWRGNNIYMCVSVSVRSIRSRGYLATYSLCIHVYIYATHVCMRICMYVCMYVYMYVCMYICMCVCIYVCMHVYMYVCDVCECKDCKVKGWPRLLPYLWRYSQARPACPLSRIGPCPNPGRGRGEGITYICVWVWYVCVAFS